VEAYNPPTRPDIRTVTIADATFAGWCLDLVAGSLYVKASAPVL